MKRKCDDFSDNPYQWQKGICRSINMNDTYGCLFFRACAIAPKKADSYLVPMEVCFNSKDIGK